MKALMIFAHPDDDTFSCAGKILQIIESGGEVSLICATSGDAGEVGTPPVCQKEELGIVREEEARKACKTLGVSQIYFLNYPDGKLNEAPSNELEDKIWEIIEKEKPDEIYTFGPDGYTNHPDHITISKVATAVFKKYSGNNPCSLFYAVNPKSNIKKLRNTEGEYDSFGKVEGTEDDDLIKVDISNELENKLKALMCHKTQNKDVERYITSGDTIDLDYEYFQKYK